MSESGVAVVRGWQLICFALVVGECCASASAQTPAPVQGEAPTRISLPTDNLGSPGPVPIRSSTSKQEPLVLPNTPTSPDVTLPPGTVAPMPKAKPRRVQWTSRYGAPITWDTQVLPDGTRRTVFVGGVIINVTGDTPDDDIELAADDVVLWSRNLEMDKRLQPEGVPATPPVGNDKNQTEFYLLGNVVIRSKPKTPGPVTIQVLRAKEVYYDVDRERAIALSGHLEYRPLLPVPGGGTVAALQPFRFYGEELRKLDAENYEALSALFNASALPSDPGIALTAPRMTMTDRVTQLRNVFGLPYTDFDGKPVVGDQKILTAYDAVPRVVDVPVGYFPYYRASADEPLGPFLSLGLGSDHILGVQIQTTWNMFELLGIKPPIGQRWTLELDYLSLRGPGFGTDYKYHINPTDPVTGLQGTDYTGLTGADGLIKYYGIPDHGTDVLGGDRGPEPTQPNFRERFLWHHQQDITPDLYFQGQVAYLSDKNFYEQYYKGDFDTLPNQETFANLTYQKSNWWLSGLIEPHVDRPWVPETAWLPKLDGALVGQTFPFFDRIVYDAKVGAGYAMMHPTETNPVSILPTDQKVDTGRLDFMQELSVPFALGPVQFAPYALLDLTGYTNDLDGNAIGRVWGGGGTRASMALSHLYEGVSSDLFNIRDLYHKAVVSANYLYAQTNVHFNQLPILDRLNDDATDQSWRNITPMQTLLLPGPVGQALATSPLYDPQLYAIRRAMLDKVDTMDDIDVLQLDVRQRLQTKRGYPGEEHEVDWMVLDTSISYFPQQDRDNFGHAWSFAEWDYLWNVGDRVAITSTGWIEPYNGGSRYWTLGGYFNRPDGTNLYLGYRQIDPLNSREVLANVTYQLSKRYYVSGTTSYDLGLHQSVSSLSFTRVGTDLSITLGVTYNSLVNNFGLTFMVMPNLFAALAPGSPLGSPMGGGR
jgi:hypothetical protein